MPKQWRFSVKLVREILEQKLNNKNLSNRKIARLNSVSKSTVASYLAQAEIAGINTIEKLKATNDEDLRKIIFPHPIGAPRNIEMDFDKIHKELSRPNVTLMLLWKERRENDETFYSYSCFCDRYKDWRNSKKITMKIIHKAGEKLFIDYAGTTVPVVVNTKTGEINEAQIFVCCLGASQLTYVEATWSQSSKDFIGSTIQSLEFFGGVPKLLVPDNLKSAVNIASKYEPLINQSYRAMAKYYGCSVLPARPYDPKGKAKVESSVLIASRWILARIRNLKFFSLAELNQVVWDLLEEFNNEKYQKLSYSRRSFFEEAEKSALTPLPASRYIIADWKKVRSNIDYHIQIENAYYSVPYGLRGQELCCRYTDTTVEVFNGSSRVASHARSHRPGFVSTNPEHMPRAHREYAEWSPSRMLSWGKTIGPCTEACFQRLMDQYNHPEIAYRACLGIIGLGKRYDNVRLENACERAIRLGAVSYRSLKSILEKGLDKIKVGLEQQDLFLDHENVRGKNYYQ